METTTPELTTPDKVEAEKAAQGTGTGNPATLADVLSAVAASS